MLVWFQSNYVWTYPSLLSCTTQSYCFLVPKMIKDQATALSNNIQNYPHPQQLQHAEILKSVYVRALQCSSFQGKPSCWKNTSHLSCIAGSSCKLRNCSNLCKSIRGRMRQSQDVLLYHLV
uniref:Uncharacterized protein n=1 Tax=Micrurus spixii TaxID=129469 RepID=A0A2D4LIT6_9SAUR